jgi:hypothetical protein
MVHLSPLRENLVIAAAWTAREETVVPSMFRPTEAKRTRNIERETRGRRHMAEYAFTFGARL